MMMMMMMIIIIIIIIIRLMVRTTLTTTTMMVTIHSVLSPLKHSDNRSASLYIFHMNVTINIRTFCGLFCCAVSYKFRACDVDRYDD